MYFSEEEMVCQVIEDHWVGGIDLVGTREALDTISN